MGQLGGLNTIQTVDALRTRKIESKDSIPFASTLQGAIMTQGASKTDDAQRIARVQELKAQVASGLYEPDLNKVASSLLRFLVEA